MPAAHQPHATPTLRPRRGHRRSRCRRPQTRQTHRHGRPVHRAHRGKQPPFEALAEAIIYQQLHGKAAAAIHRKLLLSFNGHVPPNHPNPNLIHPTPEELLDAPNDQLRSAGLSANKALALRDLAAKTLDGTVPSLAKIRRMDDAAIIENLTAVRGIGIWTVQMMLIFRLGRPNILPTSDYGVRKGFALTFQGLKPTTRSHPTSSPPPPRSNAVPKNGSPGAR